MDGIKKNVISFLHLHNLSESVHFGAGNNVLKKMRNGGVIIGPIDDWVKYGLYFKDHDEF